MTGCPALFSISDGVQLTVRALVTITGGDEIVVGEQSVEVKAPSAHDTMTVAVLTPAVV